MEYITHRHKLPLLAPAQASKHITHNEAILMLDALLHLNVKSTGQLTPPEDPVAGDGYILAENPTGIWAGHSGDIAIFYDGAWTFFVPQTGYKVWNEEMETLIIWDGSQWKPLNIELQNLDYIGIQTEADAQNRLAISSPASLFSHAGDNHHLKINKNAAQDIAGLVFQTRFKGHAELGLTGDNDLHIKTSMNGIDFQDALIISATDAETTFKTDVRLQEGAKIKTTGTDANGGLELEGSGNLGPISLQIINDRNHGVAGALFTQKSTIPGVDLVDLSLQSLSHKMNMRVESRIQHTLTNYGPEFQIIDNTNAASPIWLLGISDKCVKSNRPLELAKFTLADLPNAEDYGPGTCLYLSDTSAGGECVFSDGTAWRSMSDRSLISEGNQSV